MNDYDLKRFEKQIGKLFPVIDAEEWDNVGLQVAAENVKIKKALITLDINLQVLEYAKSNHFNVIISHHPLIFKDLKNIIAYEDTKSQLIRELLHSNIGLIVLHTNLDKYFYNLLAKKLKLKNIKVFSEEGFGSYGTLEKSVTLKSFIKIVKKELNLENLRYTGDENKKIKIIACIGGSGESFINKSLLEKKIDAVITSDIKYHSAQLSDDLNINVIDAGHFYTENIMMSELMKKLKKIFHNEIFFEMSKINTDPFKFN